MGPLNFSGKVAIVTGAGGGLGREYALLLAERGAAVVVNDLGGTRSGEGKSSSAADAVVKEIKSKGGKAVANYDSVEEGDKIVKTAIDNFGQIDILINNAGILRDKSFANIKVEDWDIIHRVHLRGSFIVTRAAWPYFRKQGYGRIIMTASGAGIYGNFGQSNYSAAKLGLLGLSNTLAIEGKKYNIHCNTIVPIAASRLTQDILPPEIFDQLQPACVSPVVAWLCHESCSESGAVIEAAGGWVGKYQWQRSSGKAFIPPSSLTVEAVRDNWETISNMSDSSTPGSLQDQTVQLMESLTGANQPKVSKRTPVPVDPDSYSYDQDNAILYALAVGLSTKEPESLNFLYENSDNFRVLPTFGTIVSMDAIFGSEPLREQMQKLNADPTRLLHGEQYLELFQPLQPSAVLNTKCRLLDILDKGSGAVAIVEAEAYNEAKERVMRSEWTIFLVGAGNFGGKRSTDKAVKVVPPPSRKPDAVLEEKTSVDQAALYRLCGDKNPIHIDPSFAAMGGFSQPILHGLCSLGYSTRHVLKQFANYDVNKFKSVMARFASPILPGQSLRTEMWREGSRIHFESMCVETGKKVISGGYVDLLGAPTTASIPEGPVTSNPASALKSKLIFNTMSEQLAQMPELAPKIQAVYEWNILKNGQTAGTWTVDLKTGSGKIVEGTISGLKPGVTLTIDDEDMFAMVTGKLDPQKAFMGGKLKLKGNIMLTQKLKPLLEARKNVLPSPQPKSEPKSEPVPDLKSKLIFKTMSEQLAQMPELAAKIQAVYEWNILKNGKTAAIWTVDLKTGSGKIVEGTISGLKPGVTLTIDDEDMLAMVTGKLDPQKAFMGGKLKLKGNIMLTQKLKPLLEARKTVMPQTKVEKQPELKCDKIFLGLGEKLKKNPDLASSIKTIYQWNILKDGKQVSTWTLDLKNGSGAVYQGAPKADKPDCTFILEDELFTKIMDGSTDPQKAFMSGKLKITGNVLASQKLQAIWENPEEEEEKMSFAPAPAETSETSAQLKSDFIFLIFSERLGEEPELAQKMKVVYNWNVLQGGKKISEWTVDLKSGAGSIYRGSPKNGKADVTITMEDEDIILMMLGKLNPQRAFMTGRLKIKGNIMLTQKLNQLWQEILKSGRAVELPILSAILADKPFDPSLRSESCFVELGIKVARQPDLVQKIGAVIEWNVTKKGKKETQWILDLKTDKGMLSRGPAKKGADPTLHITVDDDVFADWILLKISADQVLSAKSTEIQGDQSLVSTLLESFKLSSKL